MGEKRRPFGALSFSPLQASEAQSLRGPSSFRKVNPALASVARAVQSRLHGLLRCRPAARNSLRHDGKGRLQKAG